MNPEYMYMIEDMMENTASIGSASSLVALLGYVFSSLALYTIAQRREIPKPWLAWIPVVGVWILGSISDQYRYVVRGEIRNKRKVLLTVSILTCVLSSASVVWIIANVVSIISKVMHGTSDQVAMQMVLKAAIGAGVMLIPTAVLSIVRLVFEIMSLYDVYTSCDSANNVIYLVLSVIPGISHITRPLFLFLSRERDDGMPPRRDNVAEEPVMDIPVMEDTAEF